MRKLQDRIALIMKRHRFYLSFLAVLLCTIFAFADKADSLEARLPLEEEDSILLQIFLQLSQLYQNIDGEKSLSHAEQAYYLAQKIGDSTYTATVTNQLGISFYMLGELEKSRFYIEKTLSIHEALGNAPQIATSLNNMGVLLYAQGKLDQALSYYLKSSEMKEGTDDIQGIAMTLNNIGNVHKDLGNNEKALDFYQKSITWKNQINDEHGIAMTFNNMGLVYMNMEQHEEAEEYYQKSIEVKNKINDQHGLAMTINNLGEAYTLQGDFGQAMLMYEQSLEILDGVGDNQGVARALSNIADVYMKTEKFEEAVIKLEKSLEYALASGLKKQELDNNNMLYIAHKALGNYDLALIYHHRHLFLSDSLLNKDNKKYIQQIQAEYEKKIAQREARESWMNIEFWKQYKWRAIAAFIFVISLIVAIRKRVSPKSD